MKPDVSSAPTFLLGLILLLFVASSPYQNSFDKITVKEFELVDQNGKRRASIKVEPEGEIVFRLMDETGTIRVKMSGSKQGSGLVLLDKNTNPGIHGLAKENGASLVVTGHDGKKREY